MKTIHTLGPEFNKRHKWLLAAARYSEVALCGGCAAAVTRGNAEYVPSDIDFAAPREAALKFVGLVTQFLIKRSVHFRIYVNSKNAFVPSAADAHFRITCPFWLPVCLFVIPDDKFRFYRIKRGHLIQLYADIQRAAEELTEIDEKPRMATEPIEEPFSEPPQETPKHETISPPFNIAKIDDNPTPQRIGSGATH